MPSCPPRYARLAAPAEVHERLADLSMEKEDYETCMTDFKQALRMFQELLQVWHTAFPN